MASEYKQSLRIVLGKMLMHKFGKNAISNELQDKFPLFRLQQNATSCEYYSAAITSGGLTEARLCLVGEYMYIAAPKELWPGCGIAGIREAIKSKDEVVMKKFADIIKDNPDKAFIAHVKPGVMTLAPAGYFTITIGIKETISTMLDSIQNIRLSSIVHTALHIRQ